MASSSGDENDFNFDAPVALAPDDANDACEPEDDGYFDPDRMSESAVSPDRLASSENLAYMDQFGSEVALRFRARLRSPESVNISTDDRPPLGSFDTSPMAGKLSLDDGGRYSIRESIAPEDMVTAESMMAAADLAAEEAAKEENGEAAESAGDTNQEEGGSAPAGKPTPGTAKHRTEAEAEAEEAETNKVEEQASPAVALTRSKISTVGGARRVAARAPNAQQLAAKTSRHAKPSGTKKSGAARSVHKRPAHSKTHDRSTADQRTSKYDKAVEAAKARVAKAQAQARARARARVQEKRAAQKNKKEKAASKTPGAAPTAARPRPRPAAAPSAPPAAGRRARSAHLVASRRPRPATTKRVTSARKPRAQARAPSGMSKRRAASAHPISRSKRATATAPATAPEDAAAASAPSSPTAAAPANGTGAARMTAVTPMAAKGTTASRARAALARRKREAIEARRRASAAERSKMATAAAAAASAKPRPKTPRRRATRAGGSATPGYLKQTAAAAARRTARRPKDIAGEEKEGHRSRPSSPASKPWAPRTTVPHTPKLSHASATAAGASKKEPVLTTEELQARRAQQELEQERKERERVAARSAREQRAAGADGNQHQHQHRSPTRPKTPTFGGPRRAPAAGAAQSGEGYVPLAEQVAKAEKAFRHEEAGGSAGAAPRHPTEPKPFHFATDDVLAQHGAAHEVPLSTEERQLAEAQAVGPFRARPYDAAALQQEASRGIRLVPRRAPTVPQPPKLHTAERETLHEHSSHHEQDHSSHQPEFRARPMPRFDVAPLAGGRGRSVTELTTPFSPPLASKARAAAKAQQHQQQGEGAAAGGTGGGHHAGSEAGAQETHVAFKARPVPDYAAMAAQGASHGGAPAPKRLTVPKPFSLATDGRHATTEESMRRQQHEQEVQERKARQFHARGIMEGVGGSASGAAHAAPPAPTVPQPFQLQSELLHARAAEEEARKLAEEQAREQRERVFRARPVPQGVLHGPLAAGNNHSSHAQAPKRAPTQPAKSAGARRLEERMARRAAFEAQRQERAEAAAREQAEEEARAREQEEEELKRRRREELQFRARPVPAYLRGAGSAAGVATGGNRLGQRRARSRTASTASSGSHGGATAGAAARPKQKQQQQRQQRRQRHRQASAAARSRSRAASSSSSRVLHAPSAHTATAGGAPAAAEVEVEAKHRGTTTTAVGRSQHQQQPKRVPLGSSAVQENAVASASPSGKVGQAAAATSPLVGSDGGAATGAAGLAASGSLGASVGGARRIRLRPRKSAVAGVGV